MDTKYDIIIIGAGPNGLEAGAYLSKAGLKVLVLERRYECGGGLWTEESTLPGFLHSTHAVYMMMVDFAPVYMISGLRKTTRCTTCIPNFNLPCPSQTGAACASIRT